MNSLIQPERSATPPEQGEAAASDRRISAPRGGRLFVDTPLDRLVGQRTADQLAHLSTPVTTAGELLRLLPRRYDTWGDLTDLASLTEGEQATVQVQVVRASSRRTRTGRPPALMEAVVTDGTSTMDVVLFGAAGLMRTRAEQLAPGTTVMLSGKVGSHHGRRQLASPRIQVLDDLDEDEREALRHRPVPIYPATDSLPSWRVAKAVRTVLDQARREDIPDPIPPTLRTRHHLPELLATLRAVHQPTTTDQWRQGRSRLRYEEALVLQTALVRQRADHAATHHAVAWPVPGEDSLRARLDARLPYTLTQGQRTVGAQIETALASTTPMQVLLQGDVGSGKTLVALRAMTQVVGAGGQAALLAPTEVLAAQHAASLESLLGDLAGWGMLGGDAAGARVRLLTGSASTAHRREILAALAGGEPAIVVGTHALLSATVQIPFLGLVVVDEQHRFGVAQRDALRERGDARDPVTGAVATPHLLVMTATPIPRTIAMTVFGDLDTAVLDELPAGRQAVTTHLVPWERTAWVEGIWARAAREVAAGGRVFVVCPRIDANCGPDEAGAGSTEVLAASGRPDQLNASGPQGGPNGPGNSGEVEASGRLPAGTAGPTGDGMWEMGDAVGEQTTGERPIASVTEWAERLAAEPALAGIGVGILTGRMSPQDKDAAMSAFVAGRTPVLVSTTVVEVGVDVPEATMMVILDADRFGLSQLHQLRGRVGRGGRPSACVAVTGAEVGSPAFHRLKAFAGTCDGFALAEADLELRSEGNVLGATQSGRRSDLDLLRVRRDAHLIAQARADAEELIGLDPTLTHHRALAAAIADRLDEEARAYLERN